MKLVIEDIKPFRDLMEVLSQILSEVPIVFTPEGMLIEGLDKSHICLGRAYLPAEYFITYEVEEKIEIGVNFTDVIKVLKQMKGDSLTLSVKDNCLLFNLVNGTKKTKLKLKLIEIEAEDLELETLMAMEQDLSVKFELKELDELVKLGQLVGELLVFKGTPKQLKVSSEGVLGDMSRTYTDLTDFEYERDCRNEYALSYLEKIAKLATLATTCTMGLKTDAPIHFIPEIDNVDFRFILAPRVEEDEDDMYEE